MQNLHCFDYNLCVFLHELCTKIGHFRDQKWSHWCSCDQKWSFCVPKMVHDSVLCTKIGHFRDQKWSHWCSCDQKWSFCVPKMVHDSVLCTKIGHFRDQKWSSRRTKWGEMTVERCPFVPLLVHESSAAKANGPWNVSETEFLEATMWSVTEPEWKRGRSHRGT